MSKVFRLYKEGSSVYEDWNSSLNFPYNTTSRDTIEDPDGVKAQNEITSIPSPFARIDLVKSAFKEVSKKVKRTRKCDLDGNTIFHKMVSDSLDVAEIFFNIDKYQGKIEILKWDASLMLGELRASNVAGHRYCADALEKYMVSDRDTYNLSPTATTFYLLNYIAGPEDLNIIGSTSPATLFFSNANDLSYVNDIYFSEQDRPFDNDFQPLYKRDPEFVKYFFALRNGIPSFARQFPEVNDYMDETFKAVTDEKLKAELRDITAAYLDTLSTITINAARQNDTVEVLGHRLYKAGQPKVDTVSEFTIKSMVPHEVRPLVLPTEAGNTYGDLRYVQGKWGTTTAAPCIDREPDLNKRKLPNNGTTYPYLTASDFLNDVIVRVPHKLNAQNYFNGNIDDTGKLVSYLLPLKPLFFDYFTVDDLVNKRLSDGSRMIEMKTLAGDAVNVVLRIPIIGNGRVSYIEYVRRYYGGGYKYDVEKNEGGVVEFDFTGFVMPLVRFMNESDAIYNVSCVQGRTAQYGFEFYKGSEKIVNVPSCCRNKNTEHPRRSESYVLEKLLFDYIAVRDGYGRGGIILPLFKQPYGTEVMEFAVDLGTSNTHIEYRKGGTGSPQPLTISASDKQLCEMFKPVDGKISDLELESRDIEKDFIPSEVGVSDYRFPTRTVLSHAKHIDWNGVTTPYMLVNMPFTYEKRRSLEYNDYKCNIKWGENQREIEAFVRCLMLIMRNKVLLNNGDLKKTKVTWFYPLSMPAIRFNRLRATWDDAFKKYFDVEGATMSMSESAAPIQYLFKNRSTATDLVSVDIGGGTTDIAFAKDKAIRAVTSFRFAANDLFEDAFSSENNSNGIVDWYKGVIRKVMDDIKDKLNEKKFKENLKELIDVYNDCDNMRPSDMASFLFGLKSNALIVKSEDKIDPDAVDFNKILQQEDDKFKIVFVLFFTAIIYHIAQIVKGCGLELPRHISFSGNGSKVIRIVSTDTRLLAKYVKFVFEKVVGKPYDKELELLGLDDSENPKEYTCKGGIVGEPESDDDRDKRMVLKSDGSGTVEPSDTYATVDSSYKAEVVRSVVKFLDFVLNDMNAAFKFKDNFGVHPDSLRIAREIAKKDLATFLNKGIALRLEGKEVESNDTIDETFFFYPIKGVLNAISTEIYSELNKNKK